MPESSNEICIANEYVLYVNCWFYTQKFTDLL